MTAVTALVLVVASCWLGCESVPDIRFVEGDASAEGDAAGEGGTRDAAPDAADAAAACRSAQPAGATCCGGVWCLESCGPANCNECALAGCADGEVCCGKTGNVLCKKGCP